MHVVGIGPGGPLDRTRRAERAITESQVVVGYAPYLESIEDLLDGKECLSSGMTQEVGRCRAALERAADGAVVSLVSSGDPGVYGMAGLALEMAAAEGWSVPIDVVPGVSASHAAAARLGAPLMLDHAVVSLSDLLVPWESIRRRLEALAEADLVVALYNPRSNKRVRHLEEAQAIFRACRPGTTPVGIARAVGSDEERVVITDLDHMLEEAVDMRSLVIIGNGTTRMLGPWMVTPRGYYGEAEEREG